MSKIDPTRNSTRTRLEKSGFGLTRKFSGRVRVEEIDPFDFLGLVRVDPPP